MVSRRPGLPRKRSVVKCNGIELRRTDMEILNGPKFINAGIIDFYFSHLDEFLESHTLLLLPPSVTFWIRRSQKENKSFQDFLQFLNLPERIIIILAIVNEDKNLKDNPYSGKHWSLLVFVRSKNAFVHYDTSAENVNRSDAEEVCKVLRPYVSISSSEHVPAAFIQYSGTPKQAEPWECGAYVMAFAKIICKWHKRNERKNNITDEKLWSPGIEGIHPSHVSYLRKNVMSIFERLLNGKRAHFKTQKYWRSNMSRVKNLVEHMKDKILQDKLLVTYKGIAVRMEDFDSLEEAFFITNRTIEFYFSYLSSTIKCDEILLVPPPVLFWLKDSPHDEPSLVKSPDPFLPLNPYQRKIVIFPLIISPVINEDEDEDGEIMTTSKNHWSLLAFDRSSNVFVHHDSSTENLNATLAGTLYEEIRPYVSTSSSESDAPTYIECTNTPKQIHPGDCGMYVLAIARAICLWYSRKSRSSARGSRAAENTGESWLADVEKITPSSISSLRRYIQDVIADLSSDPSKLGK